MVLPWNKKKDLTQIIRMGMVSDRWLWLNNPVISRLSPAYNPLITRFKQVWNR